MKKALLTLGFSFLFLAINLSAQNKSTTITTEYNNYSFPKNDAQNPCITPQEYAALNKEVSDNLKKLSLDKTTNRSTLATSLILIGVVPSCATAMFSTSSIFLM